MAIPVCPVEIGGREVRDLRALRAKIAGTPTSEKGYENTLAKLGLHVLQDRVSELMPYFRGFQLLELSEDGEFAAGFFVFEVNDMVIDAPMFMIRGKMKGKEILFLRDRQMFVPSQEALIKHLISMRDQSLGSSGPSDHDQRNNRTTPNIDVFSQANRFMRKVATLPSFATQWGREAGVFSSYLSTHINPKTVDLLSHLNGQQLPKPPMDKFLVIPGVAEKLSSWCNRSPKLAHQVAEAYGADWRHKIAQQRCKIASYLTPKPSLTMYRGRPSIAKTASIPKVGVLSDAPAYLSPGVRESAASEIAKYGCYITDVREASETKVAMDVEYDGNEFQGPMMSGPAKVPMRTGDAKKCLVFLARDRVQTDYSPTSHTLVIAEDGSGAVECHSSDLPVKLDTSVELVSGMADWLDKFKAIGDLRVPEDEVFILVDKYGRVAGPLRSAGSNADGDLDVRCAHTRVAGHEPQDGNGIHLDAKPMMALSGSSRIHKVRKAERGTTFSYADDDYDKILMVPPDAKMMKLDVEKSDEEYCCGQLKSLPVLGFSAMDETTMRKIASFTLSMPTEELCALNGKKVSLKTAAYSLLTDYGLSKQAVHAAIDGLRGTTKIKKFAAIPTGVSLERWQLFTDKVADFSPSDRPSYSFSFPPDAHGHSDTVIPVTEKYPVETSERSQIQYANQTDPSWSGQLAPYEEPRETRGVPGEDRQVSQVTGAPKALWENSLFSALLRNVRVETQIAEQVRSMFQECDVQGRTLFLLYAHQEQFEETFGEKDLPQIEEQLLTLFEGNGELIADLLRRGISAAGDGIIMAMESA